MLASFNEVIDMVMSICDSSHSLSVRSISKLEGNHQQCVRCLYQYMATTRVLSLNTNPGACCHVVCQLKHTTYLYFQANSQALPVMLKLVMPACDHI